MILMGVAATAPAPHPGRPHGALPVSQETVSVKMNRAPEHMCFPLTSSSCTWAFPLKTHYAVVIKKRFMV